jgi:hypothetical protein
MLTSLIELEAMDHAWSGNRLVLSRLPYSLFEQHRCQIQGFISASFHRSLDGTKVTAYAQWRSAEDIRAMRENALALPYMEQALALVAHPDSEGAWLLSPCATSSLTTGNRY